MAGKRPTDNEISDLLNTPHFGGEDGELPPADPIAVVQLVLALDQIKPYDRNPRRDRNPRYDEIKESIRAQRGLNTPLNVTRRPGDDLHMVEAGGNTRLQILQELWEETREERFYRINAQYRPWVSESHVLTAHLVENELRGEVSLLDKALGLYELKEQLEEETGTVLSRNEFLRQLKEIGYTVSKRQIIRMQYLAERLYPLIPSTLQSGLSCDGIDTIRNIEKAFLRFWNSQLGEGQTEQFQLTFGDVLSQHDEDWDLSQVRANLDRQFSELCGVDISQLQTEVDALLYGEQQQTDSEPQLTENAEGSYTPTPDTDLSQGSSEGKTIHGPGQDDPETQNHSREPAAVPGDNTVPHSEQQPQSKEDEPGTSQVIDQYTGPTDLKSLRARNLVLALQISQRNNLASCIHPIQIGMGFIVDLPETPFTVNERGNATGRDAIRQFIWWMLMSASEVVNGSGHLWELSNERAKLVLNEKMHILTPLKEHGIQGVIKTAGMPVPLEFISYQFLSNPQGVDDSSFRDLVMLIENCRRLRHKFEDPGDMRLWEAT